MVDGRLMFRRTVGSARALVRIAREDGALFSFVAGQHLTVTLPTGAQCPYSICSAPGLAYVELYVSLSEPWPTKGMAVGLGEPSGELTLDEVPDEARLIFVASGSGVSPFVSMLRAHPQRRAHSTLIEGARTEQELAFREELDAMHGLIYRPTLTQPGDDWLGLRGRVQVWLEQELREATDVHVLVCGHAPMVDDVRALALSHGVDTAHIHAEAY